MKLGNNLSSVWSNYLATTSNDWSLSSVLDTTIVPGQTDPRKCRTTNGRVEVCNSKYGNNGWLGLASIWVSGDHITKGAVKLNDSYFNTAQYNTPAWRQFVTCQEVGHTFGLDHQDISFGNPNLGTCMDYTNDPDGTTNGQLSNQHPNQHDYDQLTTIYAHLDAITSVFNKTFSAPALDVDPSNRSEWGKVIRKSGNGRSLLYERDLGSGHKLFTFVIWADQDAARE
ncbi:MAG: hypothetical protein HYZ51_02315 [Candidatus Doudnabacteria bacterium]|nr:hypothetical protein [Candidatus Doudnabacteria bacterium]